MIISRRKAIYA
jgi:hypothetical protein